MPEDDAVLGEPTPPGPGAGAVSLFDGLREKHREIAARKTIDIPIPGYDGDLVARYRVLDVTSEMSGIAKRVAREFTNTMEAQLWATVDGMIVACEGIFASDKGGNLHPLSEATGSDTPVKYDMQLAQFMGFTGVGSAREVVMELFGHNEVAMLDHGSQLSRWMSNTSRRVNEEFMAGI